ncbi:hypothetical protein C8Q75DRAFT_811108 [Abortiporus biennis]|nr:hypothetical protein C8Q75DRAFT_811108 [Abortiporus biennis]
MANGKQQLKTTPPPPPSFSGQSVQSRTIWQSYAALPARTRLYFSLAITGVALAGIYISDVLEEKLPADIPASTQPPSSSK